MDIKHSSEPKTFPKFGKERGGSTVVLETGPAGRVTGCAVSGLEDGVTSPVGTDIFYNHHPLTGQ